MTKAGKLGWIYVDIPYEVSDSCSLTTTTTTTAPIITYYRVVACGDEVYHTIRYDGPDILSPGDIVDNQFSICWQIIDVTTGPEDVGHVVTVLGNVPCSTCTG
jgi:hypothetical protein